MRPFSLPPLPCPPAWQAGRRLTRTRWGPAHPGRAVCAILPWECGWRWDHGTPRTGCHVLLTWGPHPRGLQGWGPSPAPQGASVSCFHTCPSPPRGISDPGFQCNPTVPVGWGTLQTSVYTRKGLPQPVAWLQSLGNTLCCLILMLSTNFYIPVFYLLLDSYMIKH